MEHLFWLLKVWKLIYNIDWQAYFSDIDVSVVLARWELKFIAAWKWTKRFILGQSPRLTYKATKKYYNELRAATKFKYMRKKLWVWCWLKIPVVVLTLILYTMWMSLIVFMPFALLIYVYSRFLFGIKWLCWWWSEYRSADVRPVETLRRLGILK